MRVLYGAICFISLSVSAAPPPNADGRHREWFQGLRVPGGTDAKCCTESDCRTVESRWDDRTQRFLARVTPEQFSGGLRNPIKSLEDEMAAQAAKDAWMWRWTARFGD